MKILVNDDTLKSIRNLYRLERKKRINEKALKYIRNYKIRN